MCVCLHELRRVRSGGGALKTHERRRLACELQEHGRAKWPAVSMYSCCSTDYPITRAYSTQVVVVVVCMRAAEFVLRKLLAVS